MESIDCDTVFEKHCCEIKAFMSKFGHCNVPKKYSNSPSLLGTAPLRRLQ